MSTHNFQVGDEVVVESPVWTSCNGLVAHSVATVSAARVGDVGTIRSGPDADGDYYVRLLRTGRDDVVYADGLLKVADLDRLAEERAPEPAEADVETFDDRVVALAKAAHILGAETPIEDLIAAANYLLGWE